MPWLITFSSTTFVVCQGYRQPCWLAVALSQHWHHKKLVEPAGYACFCSWAQGLPVWDVSITVTYLPAPTAFLKVGLVPSEASTSVRLFANVVKLCNFPCNLCCWGSWGSWDRNIGDVWKAKVHQIRVRSRARHLSWNLPVDYPFSSRLLWKQTSHSPSRQPHGLGTEKTIAYT